MGGTGSGRWTYHEKRRTVEECWAMSISEVERVLDFSTPGSISHVFRRGIVKCCGSTLDHAATFCSSLSASLPSTNAPFSNFAPALTNATR